MIALFLGLLLIPETPSTAQQPKTIAVCDKAWQEQEPVKRKSLLFQCVEEADTSGLKSLAYINLGTLAFLQYDTTEAAHFYDLAETTGKTISSDPFFHAYRSATYSEVGRHEQAVIDAKHVLNFIQNNPHIDTSQQIPLLEMIIEPLHLAKAVKLKETVLNKYTKLPIRDWVDAHNRATSFMQINEYETAIPYAEQAYLAQPEHPAVLNSKCYLLAKTNRADEGIPYCEKALQIQPNKASILHSYAFALAKNGQCLDSQTALQKARKFQPAVVTYQQQIACEPSIPE
ncbi:MAG: tetratricopeptide repeat protein [Robiginitomaculum sp.]|nr:tetratricopeptide repeat protein [Robiginitomaculum sp.]